MDLRLNGKVAIVTGASRGIGKAIALALADEGCLLYLTARGEQDLINTASEVSRGPTPVMWGAGDITHSGMAEGITSQVMGRHKRIDILVNNVGGSFPDDDDGWRAAFAANIEAAVRMTRAVVPHMRAQGGGSIVHIASIWGREAGGGLPYNAMKAAMISHAKNSALALAKDNIRVNSVAPGSVRHSGGSWDRRANEAPEEMAKFVRENIAMGRFGTAEEIASVVAFLCSPRASWVTGACINVDGGQTWSNI